MAWKTITTGTNLWHEAHVKHPVSFIQDETLYVLEGDPSSLHKVQKSSWSSYEDVATLAECQELILDTGSSIHQGTPQVCSSTELPGLVIDLDDQLPHRGHDDYLGGSCHSVLATWDLPG